MQYNLSFGTIFALGHFGFVRKASVTTAAGTTPSAKGAWPRTDTVVRRAAYIVAAVLPLLVTTKAFSGRINPNQWFKAAGQFSGPCYNNGKYMGFFGYSYDVRNLAGKTDNNGIKFSSGLMTLNGPVLGRIQFSGVTGWADGKGNAYLASRIFYVNRKPNYCVMQFKNGTIWTCRVYSGNVFVSL